jgi:hypothetical protein
MKRFLLLLTAGLFLSPLLQTARAADVSINLFYDNLSGGNWYEVSDYGYVWQPDVATDPNWRPYTDGYWAYTDQGWTWVSYEDFGWATYHYGRWARLADYGWVWAPGMEWAPAWVSWRTGGDYVGWAPLPPEGGGEMVYESRPITGEVDIEFGIGPAYYNFVDLRYIGEPVLRDRIIDYNQNITIVRNTVNVTNITYNNSTVYNYGPDFATVSRYSVRPIQRLKLERQAGDPFQAVKNGNVTKVQGNTLVVAAPQRLEKPAKAQIAPRQVKAKIQQPRVLKGWANVDPNEKAKLEQKFKSENPKDVPKPNIQPKREAASANASETAVAASPAAHPGNRKRERVETAPTTAPAVASSPKGPGQQGRGLKNRSRVEGAQTPQTAPPVERAEENRSTARDEGNIKRRQPNQREEKAVPFRGGPVAAENARNEVKAKSETPNPPQVRENDQRPNRTEEQRIQPGQSRAVQQRPREPMQNPPVNAPESGAGPGGSPQHRERAQGDVQGPQGRGEEGTDQRKSKGKSEREATPPPQ